MFEPFLAWIINTYIGLVFEDVNTDNVTSSLLDGKVELKKLKLKKSALAAFNYPYEIKEGSVGKISIEIPSLVNLFTDPWIVYLERVHIVVKRASVNDDIRNNNRMNEKEQSGVTIKEEKLSDDTSVAPSRIQQIVENMELYIQCIHIRYEIDTHEALGFMIWELPVRKSHNDWLPVCFKENSKRVTWKPFQLKSISVYFEKTKKKEANNIISEQVEDWMEKIKPILQKLDFLLVSPLIGFQVGLCFCLLCCLQVGIFQWLSSGFLLTFFVGFLMGQGFTTLCEMLKNIGDVSALT